MLSNEEIARNKEEFTSLINSIERPGINKEGLIGWLNSTDFFIAPASTKYHESYAGGLCEHSLNVYYELCNLCVDKGYIVDSNTLKIVALMHDISKTNYYETYDRNVKHYCEEGRQQDSKGRFDWITVTEYKVRDVDQRFLFGNHEMDSEFITSQFIPLTMEESIAILHHMGKMNKDCAQHEITPIFDRYKLALLLHIADMFAVYMKTEIVDNNESGNVEATK